MSDCHYAVGDRVIRPVDVFSFDSTLQHDTIICVYGFKSQWRYRGASWNKNWPPYPECYDVQWDDGSIGTGYFHYGLSPERVTR